MGTIVPPYCAPRSRSNYLGAIAGFNVEHNAIYQLGYLVPGETWCNRYVYDVTRFLDCEIPFIKANMQALWLRSLAGAAAGWVELTNNGAISKESQAIERAEVGLPTVAVLENPVPTDHGHIGMVVPAQPPAPGVHVSAAGSHCFQNAPLSRSFGAYLPRYFTHL